ncbi:hypothetical protein ES708_14763 [subsurface metagenome]
MIGVAATRVENRVFAALGLQKSDISFDSCESVEYGGVLFLLPFLLANGLLSYKKYYSQRHSGYYDFDSVILTLAFMYLSRIKSVEQLKHYSPGEMGKLLGLDRIPEARCPRGIIKELSIQERACEWNAYLSEDWIDHEDTSIYYIDGHVQVYHGHLANLGKKHVSRQKLCLPGMIEFWVNNADGLPYFYVTGQVNEKLQEMITTQLAPRLLELTNGKVSQQELDTDELLPRFTLVFDREAYSPSFFRHLWESFRIAVITMVVNQKYSNLTQRLKKLREKKAWRQAKLYALVTENIKGEMEQTGKNIKKQLCFRQEIELFEAEEQEILAQRKQQPYRISIDEMPEHSRYNKLKTESKHLQNIIKIICYRAETAIANLLTAHYRKGSNEIRALVKSIIFTKADIYPDYKSNILTVRLNSLATPRDNMAINEICQTLNDYEAVFPGTKLKLVLKTAIVTPARDQEV